MNIVRHLFKRLAARDTRESSTAVTPAPLLLALEPRIVYDASVAAVGAAQHHTDTAAHTSVARPTLERAHEVPAAVDNEAAGPRNTPWARTFAQANRDTGKPVTQVMFVDPSVANYQELVAGLPAGTRYVVLNKTTDGLEQIAQYLQQHPGVESIHLLSHGADGQIEAGSTWLNEGDLSAYSATLAQIGAAMKPGGDFLIYGCDVAQRADGQMLVQQIASISHLNVAASTDPTGAAALGGNWTLEYTVGAVHTPVVFSKAAEQHYDGLLAVIDETYDSDVGFDTGGTGVLSTSLDGLTYTGDQNVEYQVVSGSLPNSATGGELVANTQGTAMSTMTLQRQDGSLMSVQSFDIDVFLSNDVTVQALNASGAVIGSIDLNINDGVNTPYVQGHTPGTSVFHVNLTSDVAFSSVKSIKFIESSGNGTYLSPTLDNFTYINPTSPPVLTTSGGSSAFVAADNATSTPVPVDSGITLTDGNSNTATSATVSITGNFHGGGEDQLAFNNYSSAAFGDISGSYNASTGVLTLTSPTGTAKITQWQAALQAVTYTDTLVTPNTATRTVTFQLTSDGYTGSNTVTKSVTVADTDQTPIVSVTGGVTTYHASAPALTIDSHISVSDRDNPTLPSATVSIGAGFQGQDYLTFTSNSATMGDITGSYSAATHELMLTSSSGTATDAQWEAALSSVAFGTTSSTLGNRTIAFAVSDGVKTSVVQTDTVNVVPSIQLTADSGSASFVAGDNRPSTPVAIDAGLTVTDAATSTLSSATVAITGAFQSTEDVLSFTNDGSTMGNIMASYNPATGVLTLTSANASANLAQWQSALQSVTYTDTAVTPSNVARTISFSATDSLGYSSAAETRTVTVTDTDQTPILSTTGGTTNYTGMSSPVRIDSGITISDLDNATQASGTVTIAAGFHSGDVLRFTNDGSTMGNIIGSYSATTGVLTLTSASATATNAQWESALSAVTFSSSSTTYGNRTISFATSDGTKSSAPKMDTVNVTAPPAITTDGGSAAFVAGDNVVSTPVVIDSGLTVTDGSASTLGSATVAITGNFHSAEDSLSFTNDGATMGNIMASYSAATGVLTLTSSNDTASLAQWQSALQSVTYTDTAITPNNAVRTISFSAVDSASNTSATATRTVTVTDTDQTPIVTVTGGTTNYVGGTSATTIDGAISVSDRDNSTQSFGIVSITAGFHSGDTLTFINSSTATFGNVIGSYDPSTGVLTLVSSGNTATNTQWSNALSAVTFSAGSSATPGNRTIAFTINDGTETSAVRTDTVAVLGPPTITTDGGSASFVAGDNVASTPVVIDSGLRLTDSSSPTLGTATVAITGGFHSGEDVLGFINTSSATYGNIAASYNPITGVLTLTSSNNSANLTQWQSALQSVTYTDTAITPDNTTRTIGFSAVDSGSITSNTATRTVTVTDTDQTPIVSSTGGTTNYVAGTAAATIDSGITVSDRDNTTQASGTVAITSGFHSGDTLSFTNTNTTAFGNIVAFYSPATGVLTFTSSGASASNNQWENAFSAVTFSAGSSAVTGNRTLSFTVNDGIKTSAMATDTVDVLGPPVITTDAGSAAFVAGDNVVSTPAVIDSGLNLTDGGASTLGSATVAITGNFHAGEDVLSFLNDGATMGNIIGSYDAATGVLTLNSANNSATVGQWRSALQAVTYTDTAITPDNATRTISFAAVDSGGVASNTATRTVTVTDTDQTPIVTTSGGSNFVLTTTTPVTIDSGITVSDRGNATLQSATVAITGGFQHGDMLTFLSNGSGPFTGNYDLTTGVMTVTANTTATLAQWQGLLDSMQFSTSGTTTGARTISVTVSDGIKTSAVVTDTVNVLAPPKITTDAGSVAFVAADNAVSTPVRIDSGLAISDGASGTLASATVAITGNFHAGEDVLSFLNDGATMGNITASYNAVTGVLTLSSAGGTATLAQWQAAFESVTYTDTAITPNTATRTVSFTAVDGAGVTSNTATRTVTVADTDQTPIVATSAGRASFVAGDNTASTPVTVDPGLALSDRDNATLASATVAITGNFHAGQDVLTFANDGATMGNITASYNAGTGVLTLTSAGGAATLAQWQAALKSVTYTDTAITPDAATRTISFSVNDGQKTSTAASRAVTVTDTDQTPVVTTSGGAAVFGGPGVSAPVAIDPNIAVADRDSTTLASATVSIVAGFRPGEDVLAFVNNGTSMGNITGSYNAATGVLALSSAGGTATLAQWQAALASVSYADTNVANAAGSRTVAFTVNDGTLNSVAATRGITVNTGFAGQAGQFGSTSSALATSLSPSVSTPPGGDPGTGEPVVLNALVEPTLLSFSSPVLRTFTFTAPNASHAHGYDAQGGTHVDTAAAVLPKPMPAPFNIPVTIEHRDVGAGSKFTVALASMVGDNQRIVAVTQVDGRALPAWLSYDAATDALRGHAPAHGARPYTLRLMVGMVDQAGHETYREVVLDFGKEGAHTVPRPVTPSAPQAAAKPSLAEQFARERHALHVAHIAPAPASAPARHI